MIHTNGSHAGINDSITKQHGIHCFFLSQNASEKAQVLFFYLIHIRQKHDDNNKKFIKLLPYKIKSKHATETKEKKL